jgi:hypothetical protein
MNRAAQAALQERAAERSRRAIRAAFLLSVEQIRGAIPRRELANLLAGGRGYEAVRLVDSVLERLPFLPLQTALHEALIGAGKLIGDELALTFVRKRAPWGFRAFEPATVQAAQSWIGGVVGYLKQTVRAAVVRVVLGSAPSQQTPAQTARAVLESIGLTEQQVRGAEALRTGLERQATTDAAEAAREGARAPRRSQAQAEAMLERYRRRAELMRSQTFATHEARRAAALAHAQVWMQAAEDGLIDADQTRKKWVHVGDHRVRDTHRSIPTRHPEGVRLFEAFTTSAGNRVRYPHDPLAPLEETISCRCVLHVIAVPAETARRRAA